MKIFPCRNLADLGRLVLIASAEGFRHLERLVTEWNEGINRFEKDGEILLMVEVDDVVVACGGLTRQSPTCGRVRRVYVNPESRRLGIGTALVEALVDRAGKDFETLVVFTDNPEAARLYEKLGFVPEEPNSTPDHATHRFALRSGVKTTTSD